MYASSTRLRLATLICAGVLFSPWPASGQEDDGFPREEFVRALTTGSVVVKRAALVKLDGYGDDPRVAEVLLEAVKKVKTSGVVSETTLEMLYVLGKHIEQPDVPSAMWKCLGSSQPKVVMIAVDALGELGDPAALDGLIKLLESSHYHRTYGFRKCVLEAFIKIEDRRSIDTLIEQLPELKGQLEFDVVRYLSHVSRQRFGTDSELWKTWWQDNADDFQFNETEAEFSLSDPPPQDFVWDREVSEYFGTYIYAKRLIFVLDISSSMKAAAGRGTRIQLAREELASAIEKLPEDTYFAILLFDANIKLVNPRLIQATEATRKRIAASVRRIETGRGTNTFGALNKSARVDGNAEAIFFLSDGMPSKGEITDPNEILKVVAKENFFRRISVYSYGFGMGDDGGEQFMKQLAQQNMGVYKAIR